MQGAPARSACAARRRRPLCASRRSSQSNLSRPDPATMPITVNHDADSRRRPALASWRCRITLASLVGALACGGETADVSQLTEPPDGLLEWTAPLLNDDPEILVVPTYEGSGQSVHPDIVEFPTGWNGS